MKHKNIKNLSLSAMFLAMALLLPFITAQVPEIGRMLLPMHIPVMLCGLICGAPLGFGVGLCAPFLRSLIFGRPMLFPEAVAMAPELAIYGLVTGLVFKRFKNRNILALYVSLISAMICGRAVWALATAAVMGFSEFTFPFFMTSAVIDAIPGIMLQLILIPSLMLLLRRTHILRDKKEIVLTDDAPHLPHDLLAEIHELAEERDSIIVAIDGKSASGKSTLAEALAKKLGASLFHIDDFFLPKSMRSEKRLAEPGGNFHRERFLSEVLLPLSEQKDVKYRKFNCRSGKLSRPIAVPFNKITIIEGSYAMHPELRPYYTLTCFYDIDPELQTARIIKREGEKRSRDFFERWIPLEEKYIAELSIIEACDKIITAKE